MRFCLLVLGCAFPSLLSSVFAADRYEAENFMVDSNIVQKVADPSASGGYYVNMKDGALSFQVTETAAGFYTLWTAYSQPFDVGGKIQNLAVNGSQVGQISFPFDSAFTTLKASSKIKLMAGLNTIEIQKSWGWVNIDYIELTPYVDAPFHVAPALVSPNPSPNAVKVYSFLQENFRKKVVSGFMTNDVMQNDGKYTPDSLEDQTEAVWIHAASGKFSALMGVDMLHSTGLNSDNQWQQGYTHATLAMAAAMFRRGGIPTYSWHWKDPSKTVETFYSPSSGNSPFTTFNLNLAFTDSTTYAAWDTNSVEYKDILRDLDIVADSLKTLANLGVPVLWRPLHESSGKWFWWGYKGPKACKALYKLMFNRFTQTHGLNNLIWVWVTDEAADALDWYPGDAYVDIVGRDYYYYPRIANHGSLVASFEKVKDLFGGTKLIALSENGSIPNPDSMVSDGAGWSYFMPWYGDYTMDGWAHDNTAADWNSILNNPYVITLDKMPGWANYVPSALGHGHVTPVFSLEGADAMGVFDLRGQRVATLPPEGFDAAAHFRVMLPGLHVGVYWVRAEARGHAVGAARQVVWDGNEH